jgi:hypothetical protein
MRCALAVLRHRDEIMHVIDVLQNETVLHLKGKTITEDQTWTIVESDGNKSPKSSQTSWSVAHNQQCVRPRYDKFQKLNQQVDGYNHTHSVRPSAPRPPPRCVSR